MKKEVRKYLKAIGAVGGKKSRRTITPEQQAVMQSARRAASDRRAMEIALERTNDSARADGYAGELNRRAIERVDEADQRRMRR